MEYVILVDENDNELGQMEKMQAHLSGDLHRALSVFIFNSKGELLLQQRAHSKYHSPGLWTNTCCSHPRPGEDIHHAAERRLVEEMGMLCQIHKAFSFLYYTDFDNGLIEHELDHVFIGYSDDTPSINPEEVERWRYISKNDLFEEMDTNPEQYTAWFKMCIHRVFDNLMT